MAHLISTFPRRALALRHGAAACAFLAALASHSGAQADHDDFRIGSGNLLLSRVVYQNSASAIIAGTTKLPPNCAAASCVTATADAGFPEVFNNAKVDGSFGVTSKILIDEIDRHGDRLRTIEVPNSGQRAVSANSDQMVGSFSSKSELALNLSTDGRYVTFMGYAAPVDALDISNSNTPGVVDATNPLSTTAYRLVAALDARGHFQFTETNAYSGNNGRAAIWNNAQGANVVYTAGNAGNGSNPQPSGVVLGAGAQILTPSTKRLSAQSDPGTPTPVGSFNVTQLGDAADKIGKDTNFRGLTVFNNVVYLTKGSGGNGVNTVYFIDTSGLDSNSRPLACPNGVGLPNPAAKLPSAAIAYQSAALAAKGVYPYNMCVLKGFPTNLAKSTTAYPFGVWFANATTMYVSDEGDGTDTYANGVYTGAASSKTAGLQKWVFDATQGQWNLAYVVQQGLNLGAPYTVAGYPTGNNATTNLPWAPAADGLRNLTGRARRDGTAAIFAVTSTVSGSGDQGADPNQLVAVVDDIGATSLPANEKFVVLRTARLAEALRGVSFAPETDFSRDDDWRFEGFDEGRSRGWN